MFKKWKYYDRRFFNRQIHGIFTAPVLIHTVFIKYHNDKRFSHTVITNIMLYWVQSHTEWSTIIILNKSLTVLNAHGMWRTETVQSSVFSLIRMSYLPSVLWHCWLSGKKGIWPVKNGGWWMMEWHPSGWLVCLPLLIFPCTIKSRNSVLAPAHLGGTGKRAVKWLWWWHVMSLTRC